MNEKLEASAKQYDSIAQELVKAADHYRTAARHFRNQEIPRGSAHAYAGLGHINKAELLIKSESIKHAENSEP